RNQVGDDDTQIPALFRVDGTYAVEHVELDSPPIQSGKLYCVAQLLEVCTSVEVRLKFRGLQRMVNAREVLQSSLHCNQRVSRFMALAKRSRARYCVDRRREFSIYAMRQFQKQQPHGTMRISVSPNCAHGTLSSLLQTFGA